MAVMIQTGARRAVRIALLVVVASAPVAAAAPADSLAALYNAGNAAYRQNSYLEAVAAYSAAVQAGARNSSLLYNLGDAHFRLGRLGSAILYYERSLRLDPSNEDARNNLEFVTLLTPDRIGEATPEARLRGVLRDAVFRLSHTSLAVGALIGMVGMCGVLSWWLIGGRRSGRTLLGLIVFGALFLGSVGLTGLRHVASDEGRAGIVLVAEAPVRFEPVVSARVAFVIHEGTRVLVDRQESGWALVEIANGLRGWVHFESIEII